MREVVRRLARDHWVRMHGTPRVTVLAGGALAKQVWREWAELMALEAPLLDGDFAASIDDAIERATSDPHIPIAVVTTPAAIARWREGRTDRKRAIVDEGLLAIPDPTPPAPLPKPALDARSAAEAALFEALEATPATTGRFELNGKLGVRFGPAAAEVDLLSRRDRIAIELDGYYHFTDAEAYRRDRRKDVLLQTQGLFVVRVLAEDVMRDPQTAVRQVCQALAYRSGGRDESR